MLMTGNIFCKSGNKNERRISGDRGSPRMNTDRKTNFHHGGTENAENWQVGEKQNLTTNTDDTEENRVIW